MLNSRLSVAVLAVLVSILGGCASSTPGELTCETDADCPPGRVCNVEDNICERVRIDAEPDNSTRQPPSNSLNNITPPTNNDDTPDMGSTDPDMGSMPDTSTNNTNNMQTACSPACGANEECVNGSCQLACDPACEDYEMCTANGCVIPDCTADFDPCDLDKREQGTFVCVDVGEPVGLCLTACEQTLSVSTCSSGEYCLTVDNAAVCVPDFCDANSDCNPNSTCIDWDNDFSTCEEGGSTPEGGACDPSTNGCEVGTFCRTPLSGGMGVCSAICDPFAGNSGCGAGEYCGDPLTSRSWLCTDELESGAPLTPGLQCFDPGAACDDGMRCLDFGTTNFCMQYCRPGASDCAGEPTNQGLSVCNNYIFASQRAVGLCDIPCTNNSDCTGTDVVCVDQICRQACPNGLGDCCADPTDCPWTCDPQTTLCE